MIKPKLLHNDTGYTNAVEVIMTDAQKRQKRVLLFFNECDEWRGNENFSIKDVEGMFAGALTNLVKKDSNCFACKATAYKMTDENVKRTTDFAINVKLDDEYKEGAIAADGSFVFI